MLSHQLLSEMQRWWFVFVVCQPSLIIVNLVFYVLFVWVFIFTQNTHNKCATVYWVKWCGGDVSMCLCIPLFIAPDLTLLRGDTLCVNFLFCFFNAKNRWETLYYRQEKPMLTHTPDNIQLKSAVSALKPHTCNKNLLSLSQCHPLHSVKVHFLFQ